MTSRTHLHLLLLALALAPTSTAVAQRQARASWWERAGEEKVGYYHIKTDLPREQAYALAGHLNAMYGHFSRILGGLPQRSPEKLNVLIFAERIDYMAVLKQRYGVDATGSGGMFFVNPRGTALAFWTEGLSQRRIEHVAQHEGFHQFAWSRFGADLPIWANEGLAEFFGNSVLVKGRLVMGQTNPRALTGVKQAIEMNETIPFRTMLTMSSPEWGAAVMAGQASLQYQQAWSMIHFLIYGDQAEYQDEFMTYLRQLNQGVRSDVAFVNAFGADITLFEAAWRKFALNARPGAFITAMERIEFLAEGALELSRMGIVPDSLEGLQAQLQEIGYRQTLARHGHDEELAADDASLYTIPQDDLSRGDAVFEVKPPRIGRMSRREKLANETHRMPCSIRTRGLNPNELIVKWVRDRESKAISYEIVVR